MVCCRIPTIPNNRESFQWFVEFIKFVSSLSWSFSPFLQYGEYDKFVMNIFPCRVKPMHLCTSSWISVSPDLFHCVFVSRLTERPDEEPLLRCQQSLRRGMIGSKDSTWRDHRESHTRYTTGRESSATRTKLVSNRSIWIDYLAGSIKKDPEVSCRRISFDR